MTKKKAPKKTAKKVVKKSVKKSAKKVIKTVNRAVRKLAAKPSAIKTEVAKAVKPAKKDEIVIGYKTVSSDMASWHDPEYTFTVGKIHTTTLDQKTYGNASCGAGLHFAPTQNGAMNFANDDDDFIMLEVQAKKSDILGQDSEKIRVSHLMVNKVLKTQSRYPQVWHDTVKELNKIKPFKFSTGATPQKLTGLTSMYAKASGNNVKLHTIDNVFEAIYYINQFQYDDSFGFGDNYSDKAEDELSDIVVPDIDHTDIDKYELEQMFNNIFCAYLQAFESNGNGETEAAPLVEMIKLGCLPIGITDNKLLVWAPSSDVSKFETLR